MEIFTDIIGMISFIISGYAIAVFHQKLAESKDLYKSIQISEYRVEMYKNTARWLKPLLYIIIITGYIWIGLVLYYMVT